MVQLAAAAGFDFAVDENLAVLNEQLGLTARADNGVCLEKLVQANRRLVVRCDVIGLHSDAL